jgi:flavin-dependent dehydrogenase
MDTCDVLIAGGGPAGSACAWALRRAGLDVVVADRATFPRDKACAGWITPAVVEVLRLDTAEYRRGRTFQPFSGFRIGLIGDHRSVAVRYGSAVSFGIRRCEFDTYLLHRSAARLALGTPIETIVRDEGQWIVNGAIRTPMLVGAGGHFCPVARSLNGGGRESDAALIVAQEAEFPMDPGDAAASRAIADVPELYFCRDLNGYGWCVRKGQYVNVGIGRLDRRSLPPAATQFLAFLNATGTVRIAPSQRWHGHAYLVSRPARRHAVDAGVLLVGDAAGLADPQSGEGIRPAVLSGLAAARTIVAAGGRYTRERLEPYNTWLRDAVGVRATKRRGIGQFVPAAAWIPLARRLLASPAFVRHVVLDRGFLRGMPGQP